jgi:hypothetical protein
MRELKEALAASKAELEQFKKVSSQSLKAAVEAQRSLGQARAKLAVSQEEAKEIIDEWHADSTKL